MFHIFGKFFFFSQSSLSFRSKSLYFSSASRAEVRLKCDGEMLKVCQSLSCSFRARRSFEPSHGTLRIGIGIPIFRFLCKILQSSKFIGKSKRPQKQPTKFCIGSAKNKSKAKHPRLSVLSFLTAKSGQSDQDEVRSDFEVRVDSV